MKVSGVCVNGDVDRHGECFAPSALDDVASGALGLVQLEVEGPVVGFEVERRRGADGAVVVVLSLDDSLQSMVAAGRLFAFVSGEVTERGPRVTLGDGGSYEVIGRVQNTTVGVTSSAVGTQAALVEVAE